MGRIIANKVRGMNLMSKISLILIFTLVFSTFMYQGLWKPKPTEAAVAAGTAWTNINATAPNNQNATATSTGSFTAAAGTNRILLVSISCEINAAVQAMTALSATYGGVTVNQIATTRASANRQHQWLGYILDANIPAGPQTVAVTYNTGSATNTLAALNVDVATYTGVLQSAPAAGTFNANFAAGTTVATNAAVSYVIDGMTVFVASNGGATATETITATPTLTQALIRQATQTSFAGASAVHTGAGNYASGGISIAFGGVTSARSALAVVSLRPAAIVNPTVTSASPNNQTQGTGPTTVTITGTGFQSGAVVTFSGTGVTAGASTFVNATQITVPVTVTAGAATGLRNITVTNTDTGTGTGNNLFTVNAAIVNPTVTSASPNNQTQGTGPTTVTITGTGFQTGAVVTFSGTGVTAGASTFVNATQITVPVTVTAGAATGLRNITVTNTDTGTGTGNNLFTVNAAIVNPTVTSASPNNQTQGTGPTTVTINGTGFQSGAVVTFSGTGVTAGASTFVNATQITVPVTVTAGAATGLRNITVTNTDTGTGTGNNLFTVNAAAACTRSAPTVSMGANGSVSAGGSKIYTVTVTNNDTAVCTSSTFTLSRGSETGNTTSFTLPSALAPTTTGVMAPGAVYTGTTLTVVAAASPTIGHTLTTTINASDATNHAAQTGSGPVTTTIVAYNDPLLHNSISTSSTKWGANGWGIAGGRYGAFVCETCHAKSTTNIKRIKGTITSPNAPTNTFPGSAVTFTDARNTTSDFGDDAGAHATSTKVCEVCHTYDATQLNGVKFHAYNMSAGGADLTHNNKTDCMSCHGHDNGFKSAGCDTCHGNPPTVNNPPGPMGGPNGLANSPYATGSITAGKHATHTAPAGLNYACTTCHNGYAMPTTASTFFIDISFNALGTTTGTYDGQTTVRAYSAGNTKGGTLACSSVYCHSSGQSANGLSATPVYSTPTWTGTAACGSCHAIASMATGSHTGHLAVSTNCGLCHTGASAVAYPFGGTHVNKLIDVGLGTYTAGGTPGNGYGTCSTATCHANVYGAGGSVTPTWGSTGNGCSACHSIAIGVNGPATGSHTMHAGTTCITCHNAGTTATTAPSTEHATGFIDTVAAVGYSDNKAKGSAFTTCATNICHGTLSPTWGGNTATTTCEKCHGSAATATGGLFKITAQTTNTAASIIHVSHLSSSHNYSGDITCDQCHTVPAAVNNAGHIDTALPAEVPMGGALARTGGLTPNYNSGTKTCSNMYCHGKSLASNNPTPPSSADVDPAWTATFLGVAPVVGNGNNTPGSGDCAKCHGYPPMNGAAGTHTGKIATDCTSCHTHVNAAGTGFGDATKHINGTVEGGTCNSCHGYEATSWAAATERAPEGKGAHAKHVAHLVTLWGGTLNPTTDQFGSGLSWTNVCGVCHNGATHNTGEAIGGNGRQISIAVSHQFGPSAPSYSGIPATSSSVNPKSCSNIDCHYSTTPVWSSY